MSIPWDRASGAPESARRRRHVVSWCVALVLGAVLAVLPFIDGFGGSFVADLQALTPVLCLFALIVVLAFAVFRRFLAALIVLAAVVVAGLPTTVYAPRGEVAAVIPSGLDRHDYRVLSLNISLGRADMSQLAERVRERRPAAVVLLEATEDAVARLLEAPGIKELLPHRTGTLPSIGSDGTIILSATALREEEPIWPDGGLRMEQRVAVITPKGGTPVRIAAVHAMPPSVHDATQWRADLEALGAWQRAHRDLPLVMAGDFNASQAHPAYRAAADGLADTASAAGFLPQPTWPANGAVPPFTQIDHVLTHALDARQWSTFQVADTDHLGLEVRLAGLAD